MVQVRRQEQILAEMMVALLAGDAPGVRAGLKPKGTIDDPRTGRVAGRDLDRYVTDSASYWLRWQTHYERVRTTSGAERLIEEGRLRLTVRNLEIPIAAVADRRTDGKLEAVRLYYTLWPLNGFHILRPPLLAACSGLDLPPLIAQYQHGLGAADLDKVLGTFEPDGCAREPSGGRWQHCGEDLRRFYAQLFSNGGGIVLEHCTGTYDGVAYGLEYIVRRWGRSALAPQAGIAVYERGMSGRLHAARIYDDVDPPIPP